MFILRWLLQAHRRNIHNCSCQCQVIDIDVITKIIHGINPAFVMYARRVSSKHARITHFTNEYSALPTLYIHSNLFEGIMSLNYCIDRVIQSEYLSHWPYGLLKFSIYHLYSNYWINSQIILWITHNKLALLVSN